MFLTTGQNASSQKISQSHLFRHNCSLLSCYEKYFASFWSLEVSCNFRIGIQSLDTKGIYSSRFATQTDHDLFLYFSGKWQSISRLFLHPWSKKHNTVGTLKTTASRQISFWFFIRDFLDCCGGLIFALDVVWRSIFCGFLIRFSGDWNFPAISVKWQNDITLSEIQMSRMKKKILDMKTEFSQTSFRLVFVSRFLVFV